MVKEYKQYFTPLGLAEFMVNLVPEDNIKTVIDLSMGECGLLEAAKKRWKNASLYGADIDNTLLQKIQEKSPYIHMFNGDGLGEAIEDWGAYKNILNTTRFDLAIANPPFNYYDRKSVYIENSKQILPIEIRFLLRYIDIVKERGYICIILPYGFLSLDLYSKLRHLILDKVKIERIIKVFKNCFRSIDADTCLILMQKKDIRDQYIQKRIIIEYLDSDYALRKSENITLNTEIGRFDLEYHYTINEFINIKNNCKYPIDLLEKFVVNCKRGKTLTNKKELVVEKGMRFLHTTDIRGMLICNQSPIYVKRNNNYFDKSIVKSENILIGRVGKACIGKLAIVPINCSKMVISDCIFSLQIKDIDPFYLTLYLASKYGQMQLKGVSKGSCSKYVTKNDLLKIMIIVPDMHIQLYLRKKYIEILSRTGRVKKDVLLKQLTLETENILKKG